MLPVAGGSTVQGEERCIPKLLVDFLYRRLPSLLSRGFPNPQAVRTIGGPRPNQQPRDARGEEGVNKPKLTIGRD
jgi:hypothetical protein